MVVAEVLPSLHESITKFEAALLEARSVLPGARLLEASQQCMKDVVHLAHKLSYSSYAPLGTHPQPVYGPFAAPAPAEQHLQLSKLQHFARQHAEREESLRKAEALADTQAALAAVEVQLAGSRSQGGVAAAAFPSLPLLMPTMPAGWKPGDPIPMAVQPDGTPGGTIPVAGAAEDTAPQLALELDSGIEFDFVLNADVVDSEDEESDSGMDEEDG